MTVYHSGKTDNIHSFSHACTGVSEKESLQFVLAMQIRKVHERVTETGI